MIATLFLLLTAPQAAATPVQAVLCADRPATQAAELKGWASAKPAMAAESDNVAKLLPLGSGVIATLLPTPKVGYAVRPEKPGDADSRGGIFAFNAPAAGRYRIALGSGVWIDVLSGTMPVTSVAHGHGPACSTIRKTVEFDLKPGRYLLQVAGSRTDALRMMVSRL